MNRRQVHQHRAGLHQQVCDSRQPEHLCEQEPQEKELELRQPQADDQQERHRRRLPSQDQQNKISRRQSQRSQVEDSGQGSRQPVLIVQARRQAGSVEDVYKVGRRVCKTVRIVGLQPEKQVQPEQAETGRILQLAVGDKTETRKARRNPA